MPAPERPYWQLPRGVTRGLWDYAHSAAIADGYDEYFSENRLFQFDEQIVARVLESNDLGRGAVVADLGCGTGRAIVALARLGCRGLAVDLSEAMLSIVREKSRQEELPIQCVRANLVQLDALADECADAAISLFSTLGMIRGRDNRRLALRHVQRILKPGRPFVLHVHNYWYNLLDPGGPWWVLRNSLEALVSSRVDAGDKFFDYRGVPNMFLHVFTRGELRRALRAAGFRISRFIPLDPRRHRALRWPWLLGRLRANGWIVICEKPQTGVTQGPGTP